MAVSSCKRIIGGNVKLPSGAVITACDIHNHSTAPSFLIVLQHRLGIDRWPLSIFFRQGERRKGFAALEDADEGAFDVPSCKKLILMRAHI